MEICRQDQALEIRELDPFLAELLRQVPESAQPKDSPAAEERLFSAPAAPEEKDLCAEWKVYVVPELRRLFQSATETIRQDLEQLQCTGKPFANCTLRIPLAHTDAWLNALNQARLAIGDVGFRFFAKFASRAFKFRHFVWVECPDNEEAGAVLKLFKAHCVAPSGRRKFS